MGKSFSASGFLSCAALTLIIAVATPAGDYIGSENCGMCHKDPDDPLDLFNPPRPINFNHQVHLSGGTNCTFCHGSVATTDILTESNMPKMALCMNCHTGRKANMVVRVDDEGYALKEGAQVEIGGNERYVSVSRAEFKRVFFGGQRIKFIESVKSDSEDGSASDDEQGNNSLL